MSLPIRMYDLGPSPNSKKVRLALGFKGIDHELVSVDPADRASVVELSGQPLTPVLEHGKTIIFDSSAILRYLEANVKREPRLFSSDYDEMKAIEGWESWTRAQLAPGVGQLFGQFFSETRDDGAIAKARESVNVAAKHLETSLGQGGFLVDGRPTAADVTAASWLSLGLLSSEAAARHPILQFFRDHLTIDPERQALRTWFHEIDRHDRS
jgi:glutathione S-transferase